MRLELYRVISGSVMVLAIACTSYPNVSRQEESTLATGGTEESGGTGGKGAANTGGRDPDITVPNEGGEGGEGGATDPCETDHPPAQCFEVKAACGDGEINQDREECDDGNSVPGDGCSGACQVEPYYECDAETGECTSTIECGNGDVEPGEVCDDGNAEPGDGCNENCSAVEPYFRCPSGGGACEPTKVCGDERVTGDEACDDGNADGGDGCSDDCLEVEEGYFCRQAGELCERLAACGDGMQNPGEACDDGNTAPDDGCAEDCKSVDAFWTCLVPGEGCEYLVECGDGVITGNETCDDGNTVSGDGCSSECIYEAGYVCPLVDTRCVAAECGDGWLVGGEICEPSFTTPPEACSAQCEVAEGYECGPGPEPGTLTCAPLSCNNDGTPELGETCDDGNNDMGDGCTPFCKLEPDCDATGCTSSCGDGLVIAEDCDDGNTRDGDGCSATCEIEEGYRCDQSAELPAELTVPIVLRDFKRFCIPDEDEGLFLNNDELGDSCPFPDPSVDDLANPEGHADFETFNGAVGTPVVEGILGPLYASQLDETGKPVWVGDDDPVSVADSYAAEEGIESEPGVWFSHWYNDTDLNRTAIETLTLTWIPELSAYRFPRGEGEPAPLELDSDETAFFPLDKYGDADAEAGIVFNDRTEVREAGEDVAHNFYFTSEVRYWFEYDSSVDQRLQFQGDDDVFVFVNRRLVIDLGGIHDAVDGEIIVREHETDLALTDGEVYEVVVFQAERNTVASNYVLTLSGFNANPSDCGPYCGDGFVSANEQCDDGEDNEDAYGKCALDCTLGPRCGDAETQLEEGELCDDGVNRSGYNSGGCAPGCIPAPLCGDSVVDAGFGETCDDGANDGSYGGCTFDCQLGPHCGDGEVQEDGGEECDDGVNDGTHGCAPDCTSVAGCGDGIVQTDLGEECDDGVNDGSYGGCTPECQLGPYCGDSVVDTEYGEVCDNGVNDGAYEGCSMTCQPGPFCGDGLVSHEETCDDGENDGGYGECTDECKIGPFCGDGETQSKYEECDDGNNDSGDGCTDTCQREQVR